MPVGDVIDLQAAGPVESKTPHSWSKPVPGHINQPTEVPSARGTMVVLSH